MRKGWAVTDSGFWNMLSHMRLVFSSTLRIVRRLVDLTDLDKQAMPPSLVKVILFAAFEARAEGVSEIQDRHVLLGALRAIQPRMRSHLLAERAERIRREAGQMNAGRIGAASRDNERSPLFIGKRAVALLTDAQSPETILAKCNL